MIEIRNLTRKFGAMTALDGLSFKVVPGEILGFLGPNGAGKSTTMKVITGFLAPTSGSVTVWGHDVQADPLAAQKVIGYLPEGAPCYEEMTPRTFLGFIADVRGYRGGDAAARIAEVVSKMQLERVLDQRIETLSKGFKRRVGLAQALLHDPDVLILDEPTDGLDPNQKHHVRELIQGLSRDKIVIISTHILEEVTAVCTRAIIIADGRIVADCEPHELLARSRHHGAVTVSLEQASDVDALGELFANISGIASIERADASVTAFPVEGNGRLLLDVSGVLAGSELPIAGVTQEQGRLDEVFRDVTEGAES